MADETTTLPEAIPTPTPATSPSPASRRRPRAWLRILGGALAVVLVAAAVVLAFFRLPAYRLLVGDHAFVVAVEKQNVKVALQTVGQSYAAAVKAAQDALAAKDAGPSAAPKPFRVQGTATFGLDDALLSNLGAMDATGSAAVADAVRKLKLGFDSDTAPQGGASRTDLTIGLGSSELVKAGLVALSDGRIVVDAPALLSHLLVLTPSELTSLAGSSGLPTGAVSLPTAQFPSVLKDLTVDGPALSKSLAAYADLYAAALDQGTIDSLGAQDVTIGDVSVSCLAMRSTLTGEQFASMLRSILSHASTDQVLYDNTVGAVRTALHAVVAAAASGEDTTSLQNAYDALPTFAAWTSALADAAQGVTAGSVDLASFRQTLDIATDGRVISRTIEFVPASAQADGTTTVLFAQLPFKTGSGTATHVSLHIGGAQAFDLVSKATLGAKSEVSGTVSLDLAALQASANAGSTSVSATGVVTLAYDAATDLAAQKTDVTLTLSAKADWLPPADTLTLEVHNQGNAVDSGTTTVGLAFESAEGKASADLSMTRLPAQAFDGVQPTADNSIDLAALTSDDATVLQTDLATDAPKILALVQKEAPDFYAWIVSGLSAG